MTTAEDKRPGLLVQAVVVVAALAEEWLRVEFVFATVALALIATGMSFSAGSAVWVAVGVVAAGGTAAALVGPRARHWSPASCWLSLLGVLAFDLGVILVLSPP